MSEEHLANSTSRLVEWQTYVRQSKRASSQKLAIAQDGIKSRSPSKTKSKRDNSEGEEKSNTPGKLRPSEDISETLTRTDPTDERAEYYAFMEKKDKKKLEELGHRIKMSMGQPSVGNYKRRSGGLKPRPEAANYMTSSHEKPLEKSLINNKHIGSYATSAMTYRSSSKGKNSLMEQQDNRNSKTNMPLMNFMLKKLAEQKANRKVLQ